MPQMRQAISQGKLPAFYLLIHRCFFVARVLCHTLYVPYTYRIYQIISCKTGNRCPTILPHWDDAPTSYLLDLCIEQKNLLHWNQRGLTKLGWNNVYRRLSDHIGPVYDNKQVQNKVNALKGGSTWTGSRPKPAAC